MRKRCDALCAGSVQIHMFTTGNFMSGEIGQAVILCGGLGTRLAEVSEEIPKSMMPIGDRPFLEMLVSYFKHHGVSRFVFCTGHLHDVIESHFGDGSGLGVEIVYSREEKGDIRTRR